jgi:hypothetical protein
VGIMDYALSNFRQIRAVATVKNVIQAGPEWKPKLARDVFSDHNIALAIDTCRTLFA